MIFSSQSNNTVSNNSISSDEGTIIGSSVKLTGQLESESDIQIDGFVEGTVKTLGTIVVSDSAQVKGELYGDSIVVSGTIHGNVFAKSEVKILSQGKIFGNISTAVIGIEPGAVFNGQCEITKNVQVDIEETKKIGAPSEDTFEENQSEEKKEEVYLED